MKVYFDIITNHTADVIGYRGGRAHGVRLQGRRALPDRRRARSSTTATTPARTASRRSTRRRRSRYTPVLDAGRGEPQGAGLAQRPDALPQPRRHDVRRRELASTATSSASTTCSPRTRRCVDGMIDIYKTWIRDFGVDGFRIDTMKHVDDEFWQKFGPEVLKLRAGQQGKHEFFMFGEVFDQRPAQTATPRTSRRTTRCRRCSTSRSRTRPASSPPRASGDATCATFFDDDDWYTDADSNVYQLPTFLGNHDMGRIGYFVQADNPGAGDAELAAARPAGARADVLLARQPGRLLRRRAGLHRHRRRPGRPADDVRQPGAGVPRRRPARHRRAPTRWTTSAPRTRCTRRSASLADVTEGAPGAARRRAPDPLRLRRAPASTRSRASTARSSASTSSR